jgi:hypothetical protein
LSSIRFKANVIYTDLSLCGGTDFPRADALGQILKDLDFPADKQTIVTFIEKLNSPQSREILSIIEKLDEKRYENVSEVANATGLVE